MGSPSPPPFTLDQMNQLLAKAVAHVGENGTMQPFGRMHRTKPSDHWDEIRGPLLPVQTKDGGGHQQAPINHGNQQNQRIKGLHFSAKTCASGEMPVRSPYGDERFAINASMLLHPDLFNVYFADFYCSGGEQHKDKHRISLLVVRKDRSVERDYCQDKMPQLNLFDNPFIRVKKLLVKESEELHFHLCARDDIWVEFFITEEVPLHFGTFDSVIACSRSGCAKKGGLLADETCAVCNLEPRKAVKRKRGEAEENEANGITIPSAKRAKQFEQQNGYDNGSAGPRMGANCLRALADGELLFNPQDNHHQNNQQNINHQSHQHHYQLLHPAQENHQNGLGHHHLHREVLHRRERQQQQFRPAQPATNGPYRFQMMAQQTSSNGFFGQQMFSSSLPSALSSPPPSSSRSSMRMMFPAPPPPPTSPSSNLWAFFPSSSPWASSPLLPQYLPSTSTTNGGFFPPIPNGHRAIGYHGPRASFGPRAAFGQPPAASFRWANHE